MRRVAWALLVLVLLVGSLRAQESGGGLSDFFHAAARSYEVEYDAVGDRYVLYPTVNGHRVGMPQVLAPGEYLDFRRNELIRSYWREKRREQETTVGGGVLPRLRVGGEAFDRIFGSNTIEIVPQGSAEVQFGVVNSRTENYTLPEAMRSSTTFDFKAKLRVNVVGKVGTKVRLDMKYDTEATFDFEQNIRLDYTGTEDEIIQKIEAGNVSMPLPGTLITGSQNLFGFKTDLKFGRLGITSIFSQRKGESRSIEVRGGARTQSFSLRADEYEANRHFFLSKFFYDHYDESLRYLPLINSGVEVTKLEVWVTNRRGKFENARDVLAFVDLGEPAGDIYNPVLFPPTGIDHPSNGSNGLYAQMTGGVYGNVRDLSSATAALGGLLPSGFRNGSDYEKLENARLLQPSEYTLNSKLGYISLQMPLNADEVLCVAYEYTYKGRTYKVGELSSDGVSAPQVLLVKLLKGTELSPSMPTWRLMMKNIYSLGTYQVSSQGFQLDVVYQDDDVGTKVNYMTRGAAKDVPLLTLLSLDRLNAQGDAGSDGVFDYVEGVTVQSAGGRVIFPVVEPFGAYLADKLGDPEVARQVAYTELYDSTLSKAEQVAEKNKFYLEGEYKSSSSSEIQLNAPNVPRGSVLVTAGGRRLVENTDYVVDYLLGTVRIINQGLLESGTPIKVSLESDMGLNLQVRRLLGTHMNYHFWDGFDLGATVLNLSERPFTKKVSYGQEAISNTIWGLDMRYTSELPWLTRAVDALPLIDTKAPSHLNVEAEFAHFIPGQSRYLAGRGSVYLDDFEANKTNIDLRMWNAWSLASVPQGQPELFPEASLVNNLDYGKQRALLAWYSIDPLFLRNSSLTPPHIRNNPDAQSSHFVREVVEQEIFPNRNTPQGMPSTLPVLNVAFYPAERGPYNYDSQAVNADGTLQHASDRWGGIMRSLVVTDFESSNIEYLEFWLMDPFVEGKGGSGGDLYVNLGNVSEDILRDGQKSYENGLPVRPEDPPAKRSAWGLVPSVQNSVMAFDNDPANRAKQDVGLDGLSSAAEQDFFGAYIGSLRAKLSPAALERAQEDPSSDDFRYFRSTAFDEAGTGILDRYKHFNGPEGNSPTSEQSTEAYPTSATTQPDMEDVNKDYTLSDNESYYQYRVSLRPGDMLVGRNYVTDKIVSRVELANGQTSEVSWYQFKIPVKEWERRVGHIEDFKSIRFIRLFLHGFSAPIILRFATLGLVRGEWRRYDRSMLSAQESLGGATGGATTFEVSAVNIEENSRKSPVNYVMPPGVTREIDASQTVENELNEQSMVLRVQDLGDGDARAAYKMVGYDMRQYERIAMDVHGEQVGSEKLLDGELSVFLRLGSDYTDNYYECEVPLHLTSPGVYSNDLDADRALVWPEENRIEVTLKQFREVKLLRNNALRRGGISLQTPFSVEEGGRRLSVVGNPSFSSVRVLMIGIRNPKQRDARVDDGYPKSAEVWVNELRLSKVSDRGGVAAIASASANLADLGNLSVNGRLQSPGFGALEDRINGRVKEMSYEYTLSGDLEFGRFFPKRWGVSIPLYATFGQHYARPQYNPLDEDVPFEEALSHLPDRPLRDSLRSLALDFTQRQGVNVTNIRVAPEGFRGQVYDPGNVTLSYAYSGENARNVKTEYRNMRTHRGSLAYAYNGHPRSYEPFRQVRWLQSDYLALIRDINFTLYPRQMTFKTDMQRDYQEQQLRSIKSAKLHMPATYIKRWEWNRMYGFNWDLMRSLHLDYSATNLALIDEPLGAVNGVMGGEARSAWRAMVLRELGRFGRTTQYDQTINATYAVPINKLPFLDWVTGNASYRGEFRWHASPVFSDTVRISVGNTVQNARTVQLNGQMSFFSLYRKVGYLRGVLERFDKLANGESLTQEPQYKTVRYEGARITVKAGGSRTVTHNLGVKPETVTLYDEGGREVSLSFELLGENKIRITVPSGVRRGRIVVEGKKEERTFNGRLLAEGGLRMLMMLKDVSVSWVSTGGTFLPGYLPGTMLLGMESFKPHAAPGFPFVLGWQDESFGLRAAERGWLTTDGFMQDVSKMTSTTTWSYRVSLEPFPYFRIELTGQRSFSRDQTGNYRAGADGQLRLLNPQIRGSLNLTTILIGTAFDRSSLKRGYQSQAYARFLLNRLPVARRLAAARAEGGRYSASALGPDGVYPSGYGALSQEVLVPAIISSYMGVEEGRVPLYPFLRIPLPNWSITYDGLSRLRGVKSVLRQLTLRHAYRANYVIGGYVSNEAYEAGADGFSYVRDQQENFVPQFQLGTVSLTEQFSPLIGVDMGWVNSLTTKLEVRKSRALSLSFSNNQLSDQDSWEFVVGAGYRFENLPLLMKTQLGGKKVQRSELRLQADFSWRDTQTILHKLSEGANVPMAGQRGYTIKLSADYMLTEQITVRAYFDRVVNTPLVSFSFPTSNTSGGISIRFSVEQ